MNKFANVLKREVVEIEKVDYKELLKNIKNPYTGTLEEIIDLVLSDQLVPVYIEDRLVGINMITNASYIEDQILQSHFQNTYSRKPIMVWVQIALDLKAAAINKVKVVKDNILVAAEDNIAFDLEGNELANVADLTDLSVEAKELILSGFAIDELNKQKAEKDLIQAIKNFDPTLPNEVEILLEDLDAREIQTIKDNVKRYLTYGYRHCISRGTYPTVEFSDTTVKISNIQWGRKLTDNEYDNFMERHFN